MAVQDRTAMQEICGASGIDGNSANLERSLSQRAELLLGCRTAALLYAPTALLRAHLQRFCTHV